MTPVFSWAGLAPVVSITMDSLLIKNRGRAAFILCSLLLVAGGLTASARQRSSMPFRFEVKTVDSATGKPKSKYVLGETVSVVFTLTNQSSRAQTISKLEETSIPYELVSIVDETPETVSDSRGGVPITTTVDGPTLYWLSREPEKATLAPGQSVSVKIDDLRGRYSRLLEDGYYRFTATYMERWQASVSFRIVIDVAKSIPLLEQIAETSPPDDSKSDRSWANSYLEKIRRPSLGGVVTDTAGKPLKDVEIDVTGPDNTSYDLETESNGRYYVSRLTPGTYTLTPSLRAAGNFDAEFTFDPPSRTVTNLNSKLTNLNFTATQVRPSVNVAEDSEGATATASSTLGDLADMFTAENVIDSVSQNQWDQCCNAAWVDATPDKYPDWVEINFNGPKAINWINVFTLQDDPENSPEPTLTETFTKEGITDFDVQYWNGRAWRNVPGGAIRGNRNVWRKLAFPTITTNKIRVVVRKALGSYSKIMEIEAFHINELPVVKLTGKPRGKVGSSFEFQGHASDKDSAILKYTLDYGDGTPNYEFEWTHHPTTMKQLNLTHKHTYAVEGTYTVTLRAIDRDSEGAETTMTVTVAGPGKEPQAKAVGPHQGVAGEALFFDGRASSDPDGRIVRHHWDFGDDKGHTASTAWHTFAAPGTYKVTLVVVDNDGNRTYDEVFVLITPATARRR
ncbi:MAG TPA: PKD domain-containing protein [Pyrinomonadaceae bacterium]